MNQKEQVLALLPTHLTLTIATLVLCIGNMGSIMVVSHCIITGAGTTVGDQQWFHCCSGYSRNNPRGTCEFDVVLCAKYSATIHTFSS